MWRASQMRVPCKALSVCLDRAGGRGRRATPAGQRVAPGGPRRWCSAGASAVAPAVGDRQRVPMRVGARHGAWQTRSTAGGIAALVARRSACLHRQVHKNHDQCSHPCRGRWRWHTSSAAPWPRYRGVARQPSCAAAKDCGRRRPPARSLVEPPGAPKALVIGTYTGTPGPMPTVWQI